MRGDRRKEERDERGDHGREKCSILIILVMASRVTNRRQKLKSDYRGT